ncbi:tetratricopeptide repeat protein [Armatimonas rosea]|uniref:Tetratricopeptide (TPR) repeat protein n=1 Tax=Armatimonas rosea TaxID=685828 RepID=A0A7W9SVH9_ARMRO|nr:tetratricopeptide repeat protein [Armatimonas rosea]MBB6052768.1 tetratricopeptide (TPR) repeat protein [Armatimonas rosea]
MADITNVNLVFLRKARGLAPLSRYALQDDGTLLVSVPDELEVRTFHLVRYSEQGRSRTLHTYNVETLRKTEITPDGSSYVGTTDDDLYLFREARKTRFLSDRRASYTDISLGAEAARFGTAFCDLLGSGHSVALGELDGRLLWTKDIAYPISRICIDRGARYLAIAGESGDLSLVDYTRTTIWSHRQEVPLLAVATAGPERTAFATGGPEVEAGGVGLVGSDGVLLWFTELVGTPIDVAMDATGQSIAVLLALDHGSGRLVFLNDEGMPIWDIDFEDARPTGISVAPGGRFVAVSLRDGSLIAYELTFGERMASLSEEATLAEARGAWDKGNVAVAAEVLRARLDAVPSDLRACQLLSDVLADLRQRALGAAETAETVGDFVGAAAHLAQALQDLPHDLVLTQASAALQERWYQAKLLQAQAALSEGNTDAAEAAFLEAIQANPLATDARTGLAQVRYAAAESALSRGRGLLMRGDAVGAILAFTEARQKGVSGPDLNELVRQARVTEAMALGNALYQDQQYAAALFQYKKALRLDPDNGEALQKLRYAQNFLQDTQLSDRFSRLE